MKKQNASILDDPSHLEFFKLADHKLDGKESPAKASNLKQIKEERDKIKEDQK